MPRKPTALPAPKSAPSTTGSPTNTRSKRLVVGLVIIICLGVLWLFLHDRVEHRADADPAALHQASAAAHDWLAKYDALKTMLDESGHDDEHHDEFILLAEAAKSAIKAEQGGEMLERMNADLANESAGSGPQRISELAKHTEQWKIIVEALVMNKEELLDHEKFKGHHQGEL